MNKLKSYYNAIIIFLVLSLLLLASCSYKDGRENFEGDNRIENNEATAETTSDEDLIYPLIYDEGQIATWISKYKGRWIYEGGEIIDTTCNDCTPIAVFMDLQITETQKDSQRYCILGANALDGYFFNITGIEQQSKDTYILTVEGLKADWNNVFFPTNRFIIVDQDTNDNEIKLQFEGVYKSTIDNFVWSENPLYDSIPLENVKLSNEYYLEKDEWYVFKFAD